MPVCLPELGVELPYDNTLTRAGSQIWSTLVFSMGCLCMPETVFSSCLGLLLVSSALRHRHSALLLTLFLLDSSLLLIVTGAPG